MNKFDGNDLYEKEQEQAEETLKKVLEALTETEADNDN